MTKPVILALVFLAATSFATAEECVRQRKHVVPRRPSGQVITRDYYIHTYVDPKLRYFYPAWTAVGDGDHYLQLGEPGWRMVRVAKEVYVFGPGYCLIGCPFAYGPGDVVFAASGNRRVGVPLLPFLPSFPFGFFVHFEKQ